MKPHIISAAILIALTLSATAWGQECSSHRRLTRSFQHVDETPSSRTISPRAEFTRAIETNCHPSRSSVLMTTVQKAGKDQFFQPAVLAKITAIRNRMSVAERKETAKLFRIQANLQKYEAQQALKEERIAKRERDRELSTLASAR